MNEYFNQGSIDWPVFGLGAIVGLLVMLGASYLAGGDVAIVAGILSAVLTYGNLARPDDAGGK